MRIQSQRVGQANYRMNEVLTSSKLETQLGLDLKSLTPSSVLILLPPSAVSFVFSKTEL